MATTTTKPSITKALELSIAQHKISDQLKSGNGTDNILTHLGPMWRGDTDRIKHVNKAAIMARSFIIEARVGMIMVRDELLAEEGVTPEEADALLKGLLDGFKSAINEEVEKMITHVYSV